MTRKKLAALVLGAALTLSSAVCAASVPSDQLSLGGIEYGMTEDTVRSIYGTPTDTEYKQSQHYNGTAVQFEYGDNFEVTLVDGIVRSIEAEERSDQATPAGIQVGMSVATLKDVYGEPDIIRGNKYIYRCDDDSSLGLVFEIRMDKIDEIAVGTLKYR